MCVCVYVYMGQTRTRAQIMRGVVMIMMGTLNGMAQRWYMHCSKNADSESDFEWFVACTPRVLARIPKGAKCTTSQLRLLQDTDHKSQARAWGARWSVKYDCEYPPLETGKRPAKARVSSPRAQRVSCEYPPLEHSENPASILP
jgi:hypothetical protein